MGQGPRKWTQINQGQLVGSFGVHFRGPWPNTKNAFSQKAPNRIGWFLVDALLFTVPNPANGCFLSRSSCSRGVCVCVHEIYFDTGASPACDEGPGVCSRLLTVFSLFLIIVSLPLSLFVVVKVVQVISIISFTFLRNCQSCPGNCHRHLWKSSSSPPSPSWSPSPSSPSVSRPGIVHFIIVFRARPFWGLHEPTNSLFLENLGSYLQSATLPLSKQCHRDKKKRCYFQTILIE